MLRKLTLPLLTVVGVFASAPARALPIYECLNFGVPVTYCLNPDVVSVDCELLWEGQYSCRVGFRNGTSSVQHTGPHPGGTWCDRHPEDPRCDSGAGGNGPLCPDGSIAVLSPDGSHAVCPDGSQPISPCPDDGTPGQSVVAMRVNAAGDPTPTGCNPIVTPPAPMPGNVPSGQCPAGALSQTQAAQQGLTWSLIGEPLSFISGAREEGDQIPAMFMAAIPFGRGGGMVRGWRRVIQPGNPAVFTNNPLARREAQDIFSAALLRGMSPHEAERNLRQRGFGGVSATFEGLGWDDLKPLVSDAIDHVMQTCGVK